MGRQKLPILKLEANKQQQTFSRRRAGLFKKANDLSILCDVDILLVVFPTKGKPFLRMGENSNFEAVVTRYANIAAQERNKRRVETLQDLKQACKKGDHEINFEELVNQDSQLIKDAYTDEINKAVNLLGSLIDIQNINNIEDVNVLENMEKEIVDLLNRIRIEKENNLDNYSAEYGMDQFFHPNEEPSPFSYSMNDGQQVVPPHNPILPQWDPSVSMESDKIDNILQNKGGINGNGNRNGNANDMYQEEWFNELELLGEPADLDLLETLNNGTNDYVDISFEENVFFKEKNADQGDGKAAHDSNFQNWIFKPSDF